MKLELKHLAPYLPYKLKVKYFDKTVVMNTGQGSSTHWIGITALFQRQNKENCLPILRPLSDYADIDSDAMNDLNCDMSDQIQISEFASKRISLSTISVGAFDILVSNHVDVFGLIDHGLALQLI